MAGPPSKIPQISAGNTSSRERAESSASSAHVSQGEVDSRNPSVSLAPGAEQQPERGRISPAARSDPGGLPTKATVSSNLRPSLAKEHSQAEDELIETYNMLEASATRTPSNYTDSPLAMPTPREAGSIYEQDVYLTFASAYGRLTSRNRQEVIKNVSSCLVDSLKRATDTGHDVWIVSLLQATRYFATEKPKSVDFLLYCLSSAFELFPEDVVTEYGRGPSAGTNRLRSWLQDESLGFRGELTNENIGQRDTADRSNIKFRRGQVSKNLEGALAEISAWKRHRTTAIVMAAIHARAFAMGILRISDGRRIEDLINAGLIRRQVRWSKVDLIGSCVIIRACGQTLSDRWGAKETPEKRQALQIALEGFLLQDSETWDDDFGIKAHATVGRLALIMVTDARPTDDARKTWKLINCRWPSRP